MVALIDSNSSTAGHKQVKFASMYSSPPTCSSTFCFHSILTIGLCAKSLNPPRDLLRLSLKSRLFGSACAVSPRTNRFATDRIRKPGTKKAGKSTSTTRKATGGKSVRGNVSACRRLADTFPPDSLDLYDSDMGASPPVRLGPP